MLRAGTSTFSVNTLVPLPTTDIDIDRRTLSEKPKISPLLTVTRTPSPDKPLPVTPSSSFSSPISTDGSSPDSAPVRGPIDPPHPSATFQPKVLPPKLIKRTHALLDLIESERDYASDLALIRDIYLPIALGMSPTSVAHIWHSSQHPLMPRTSNSNRSILIHHSLHRRGLLILRITRPINDARRRANYLWQYF